MDRRAVIGAGTALAMAPAACAPVTADVSADWAAIGRFAAENAALLRGGARPGIVFLGDSITERWPHATPDTFTAGRVARGVGGQTTRHLMVRMVADVIALHPRWVHVMAGTNDVAGNDGPIAIEQTCANLRALCQLARTNGIDVILASVPPATRFDWRADIDPVAPIAAINRWIAGYAAEAGLGHVDYGPGLRAPAGGLRPDYGRDGVHPDAAGYRVMSRILEPLLRARGV